jgi:hypothetical protein
MKTVRGTSTIAQMREIQSGCQIERSTATERYEVTVDAESAYTVLLRERSLV